MWFDVCVQFVYFHLLFAYISFHPISTKPNPNTLLFIACSPSSSSSIHNTLKKRTSQHSQCFCRRGSTNEMMWCDLMSFYLFYCYPHKPLYIYVLCMHVDLVWWCVKCFIIIIIIMITIYYSSPADQDHIIKS